MVCEEWLQFLSVQSIGSVFLKTKTVFTYETKNRVEVKKVAKLWPYIPVRSDNRTGSQLELVVDMDFSLKPVKEYFTPIRK